MEIPMQFFIEIHNSDSYFIWKHKKPKLDKHEQEQQKPAGCITIKGSKFQRDL